LVIGTPIYTNKFRGEKYVRSQQTAYDSVLKRHVNVYTNDSRDLIYGYGAAEYYTPSLVSTYITNGQTILDRSGWKQTNNNSVKVDLYPPLPQDLPEDGQRKFVIVYDASNNNSLVNSGFKDNADLIKEVGKDQEYIFRIKPIEVYDNFSIKLCKYIKDA
jgi:hypothetical protein